MCFPDSGLVMYYIPKSVDVSRCKGGVNSQNIDSKIIDYILD
jgi:hypothetical protein